MPGSIQLVIFDLDGTLIDAYQAIAESFNYAMHKLGLPAVEEEKIRRAVGWGEPNLFKPFLPLEDVDKAIHFYREHHTEAVERGVKLLPGAKELLGRLEEKEYKLAVASNRPTDSAKRVLNYLGIEEFFDEVLCGDTVNKYKPDPGILLQILENFSMKPEDALYVGDMTIDVETGQRAQVKTVAVVTGSSSREEIEKMKPYKIVDNILTIESILEELKSTSPRD